MGCAHNKNTNGFTLVEIAIVMIIVGLLIGGTFGGMKLIENMQVNRTVQDLKSVESAALTFKDTYGRLPGDLPNTAARLPNCASGPCATGGNGDRKIGGNYDGAAITATDEEFLFWQHLLAASLISTIKPVSDLTFGEGQPEFGEGGARIIGWLTNEAHFYSTPVGAHTLLVNGESSGSLSGFPSMAISCNQIASIDRKMDDGEARFGKVIARINQCVNVTFQYQQSGTLSMFIRKLPF